MVKSFGINRVLSAAAAVLLSVSASGACFAQCAGGDCGGGYGSHRDGGSGAVDSFGAMASGQVQPLFNNYFTQGGANQAEAGLYMSPIGVPGWVGHTYHTYQPLYPHQYLYSHHDRYHSYYDGGAGLNRTSAHYYHPPVRTAAKRFYKMIEIPR